MDTLVDFMGGGQYESANDTENATETVLSTEGYDGWMMLLELLS